MNSSSRSLDKERLKGAPSKGRPVIFLSGASGSQGPHGSHGDRARSHGDRDGDEGGGKRQAFRALRPSIGVPDGFYRVFGGFSGTWAWGFLGVDPLGARYRGSDNFKGLAGVNVCGLACSRLLYIASILIFRALISVFAALEQGWAALGFGGFMAVGYSWCLGPQTLEWVASMLSTPHHLQSIYG